MLAAIPKPIPEQIPTSRSIYYGNICAAEAVRDGSVEPGVLVCQPVFDGGRAWGSALIRWQSGKIRP